MAMVHQRRWLFQLSSRLSIACLLLHDSTAYLIRPSTPRCLTRSSGSRWSSFSSRSASSSSSSSHLAMVTDDNDSSSSSNPPKNKKKNHASSLSLSPQKTVVIAGAGIIGTSTAYYLAKEFGIPCILVDPTGIIAPAASGKAGGFLALDWNDYSPVGPLTRRSFTLHQELAITLGAELIQYRRLTCASIAAAGTSSSSINRPKGKKLDGVEWVEGAVGIRPLGNEETIAQVHPKRLCEALFAATQKLVPETKIVKGKVIAGAYLSKEHDDDDEEEEEGNNNKNKTKKRELVGAKLEDGSVISADALLYACGPWMVQPYADETKRNNIMTGVKYHSLVVPTREVLSQCVFFSGCGDPEVYVRPDSTAYCTGFPDPPVVVTEHPGEEEVRPDAIERIRISVEQASSSSSSSLLSLDDSTTTKEEEQQQACYLPSTLDGIPIMGSLEETKYPQSYVAAGHSCWGILMGPASGEAMAHYIVTGKSPHVDMTPFQPSRLGL